MKNRKIQFGKIVIVEPAIISIPGIDYLNVDTSVTEFLKLVIGVTSGFKFAFRPFAESTRVSFYYTGDFHSNTPGDFVSENTGFWVWLCRAKLLKIGVGERTKSFSIWVKAA